MNQPIRIVVACALTLGLGACKKPKPSPEFAEAEAKYSHLYAEKFDDAYTDPRMAPVEALLGKVLPDSLDAKAAADLLAKIRTERDKQVAEAAARKKAIDDALKPVEMPPSTFTPEPPPKPPEPAAEVEAPDAGATQPLSGMTATEFINRFSACFATSQQIEVIGQGLCDAYELKDQPVCRTLHPGFVNALVMVGNSKVLMIVPKSNLVTKTTLPDGGYYDAGT